MNVFTVILIILAVLFAVSLVKVKITFVYKNRLKLIIKVLFYNKTIVKDFTKESGEKPEQKKKKPKKKKKSKKDKPNEKNNEKPKQSLIRKFFSQQGISGLLEIVKQLLILIKGTLRYFFKHFFVHKLVVKVTVASDDAAKTAINYGKVSAVIYPLFGHLSYALNIEDYKIDVLCDFDETESEAYMYMYGSIRIAFILVLAAKAAVRAAKTYLQIKIQSR